MSPQLYTEAEIAVRFKRPEAFFLDSKTIRAGAINARYADGGSGTPVLLIHGFPETLQGWRRVFPELSKHFRLLAPDMPGVGGTDKPDISYKPQEMAAFLKDFLDAVGVERAHVVGTDTGLATAVAFAGTYPDRTDRLVLSAGTVYGEDVESWEVATMTTPAVGEILVYTLPIDSLIGKGLRKGFVQPALVSKEFREECCQSFRAEGARRAALRMMRETGRQEEFLKNCLKSIRKRTLVIYADKDCYFPLDSGKRLAKVIPDAEFKVIPDCGHFLQEEKPDEYSAIVREFLQRR